MKNLKCDEVVPETKFVTEHDKKNRGNAFSISFEMQEKIFGFTIKAKYKLHNKNCSI